MLGEEAELEKTHAKNSEEQFVVTAVDLASEAGEASPCKLQLACKEQEASEPILWQRGGT